MGSLSGGIGSGLEWGAFLGLMAVLLALDLAVLERREPRRGLAEALLWSAGWTALALLFNLWVLCHFGRRIGLEFLTAYLVERSLSFDNLLVFLVLFDSFAVPHRQQRRVLYWGIVGALLGRGVFIGAGTALARRWGWLLPLLGLFLVYTGARVAARRGAATSRFALGSHLALWLGRRYVPMADGFRGRRLLVREGGRTLASPLLLLGAAVGAADVAFAVDSLPAVLGVSRHPFIVFSSNVFAVLGLRALYPLVAALVRRLSWLPHGLGVVLILVGGKMLAERWLTVPIEAMLAAIVLVLGLAVAASLRLPPPGGRPPAVAPS
jgi:tellurite resistance protein TerC